MELGIALRQARSWAPWGHRDGLLHVCHLSQERPHYSRSLKKEKQHLMGNYETEWWTRLGPLYPEGGQAREGHQGPTSS